MSLILLSLVALALLVLFSMAFWLFFCHGIDKIKHPEEWRDAGRSGERILYNMLVRKFKIPEGQIFRNVYIPRRNGKTSEMDPVYWEREESFL
ncbi:hypothetical protein IJG26_02230 [Candidatus Saccharibacteria bacterium]|nr:hypothetical protein [Candidatus Saccharibacteria bacterium]MBR0415676.1 hypothetical protein [Candidatus Saccharibacteria bacterium]